VHQLVVKRFQYEIRLMLWRPSRSTLNNKLEEFNRRSVCVSVTLTTLVQNLCSVDWNLRQRTNIHFRKY